MLKLTNNLFVISDTLAPVLELSAASPAKEVVLRQNESNCAVVHTVLRYHLPHGFMMHEVVINDGDALTCFDHWACWRSLRSEAEHLLPVMLSMQLFHILFLFN